MYQSHQPVAEIEAAQEHAELALVDGTAAVLVHLRKQQLHELYANIKIK